MEAKLVKYFIRTMIIGGPGPDKNYTKKSKAVFIPSEQIFVRPDGRSDLICGPAYEMYEVIIGEKAKNSYEELIKELKKIKPKEIEVSESFVTWARSLHNARNPNKEISDLLDPDR